ncbi:MAG TPA: alanine racemase, partial [Novosphingobium sp.]|nr:alanine racemase [Novosphingobium sp.]
MDKDALIANWTLMNRLSGAAPGQARAGAAVKADAYGLGAVRVAALLWGAGCRMFFVAHWQEAAALLGVVPAEAIAVLHGPRNGAEADFAVASGVVPVINSALQARVWRDAGGGLCHLMIDTG